MLKNIIVMQEDKEKKLQELMKKDETSARRTTIILEKEERAFIDSLIKEGKEPGIKPLISKMLDVYRSMMIYDWRFPGEYYCGISRVAFVNAELVSILINNVPTEKWRSIGKKMGEATRVSIETAIGIQTTNREKWPEVFKRLRVQGFGDFYLKAKSAAIDPVEKKPLAHFNPGASVLSIATIGCNFRCQFCDNWMISQEKKVNGKHFPPEEVIKAAGDNGCEGVSYTYTEPTIFFEYAYDTAKLARQVGFFNTFVTNGYMTPEAVKTIAPYLDAVTVDFKGGGDPEFYKTFSSVPSVAPIFEALKEMRRNEIHIEITNLIVPK